MHTKLLLLFFGAMCFQPEPINIIWMKADKFAVTPGEKVSIQVTTGRDLEGTPVDLKKDQFVKAEHHTFNSAVNIQPQLNNGLKDHLTEALTAEGTHAIILRTNPAITEIDAETFNAYLKEYSVDDVIELREKKNATDKSAKVSSSWYSSLILQAGAKRDDTYKKDGGYPLEIVPLGNPYDLKKGDVLRVKILWNDKPLFGARVKVWVRTSSTTIAQPVYTQQDGTIEAPVSGNGIWTITVVKLIPSRNPEADWQGYQTSLTFGL